MAHMVTGIFQNYKAASRAITSLKEHGISDLDLSILASENAAQQGIKIQENSKAPEGTSIGAGVGGVLGAIAAGLTAVGTITATGGASVLAAGPIVSALTGAGAGGLAGGIIGGLIGWGMPETEAKLIDHKVGQGYVLIGVPVEDERKEEIKRVFKESNAEKITLH